MPEVARIGVSISEKLLKEFDALIERRGYGTRSEAFRDMIRNELVNEISGSPHTEICGTVTLIYDHHASRISERLNQLQHDHHGVIVSTVHVHLDHDNCMEVILVRGITAQVRKLADSLIAIKGVKNGRFTLTASGRHLP